MGKNLNVWDGTKWTPARQINVWDGTKWKCAEGHYWDGVRWVQFTYCCNNLYLSARHPGNWYMLDVKTMAAIKQVVAPVTNIIDIGGIENRLYGQAYPPGRVFELTKELIILKTHNVQDRGDGVGGTKNHLFMCDEVYIPQVIPSRIREINPDNAIILRTVFAPGGGQDIEGIGGTKERLYFLNEVRSKLYELNLSTLAAINSRNVVNPADGAVGGTSLRVFMVIDSTKTIHEINPDTLASIKIWRISFPGIYEGIGSFK